MMQKNKQNQNQQVKNESIKGSTQKNQQDDEEDVEEEFEEEYEEDLEEDQSIENQTRSSITGRNRRSRQNNQRDLMRNTRGSDAMKTINKDGVSVMDNTISTINDLKASQSKDKQEIKRKRKRESLQKQEEDNQKLENSQKVQRQSKNNRISGSRASQIADEEGQESQVDEGENDDEFDEDGDNLTNTTYKLTKIKTPLGSMTPQQIQRSQEEKSVEKPNNEPLLKKQLRNQNELNIGLKQPQKLLKAKNGAKGEAPLKSKLPYLIESNDSKSGRSQKRSSQMGESRESLSTYKEVVPSFLPNKQRIPRLNEQEGGTQEMFFKQEGMKNEVDKQNSQQFQITRQARKSQGLEAHDPYQQHIDKMEYKLRNRDEKEDGGTFYTQISKDPLYTYQQNLNKANKRSESAVSERFHQQTLASASNSIQNPRNSRGFKSVVKERVSAQSELNNQSLPIIRGRIEKLEKKMERELDMEAKLKKDAKRLIIHSLGKDNPQMDRNVKAWLRPEDDQRKYNCFLLMLFLAYLNSGPPFSKEYRELIQKELLKDKQNFPVIEQFLKKGLFDQMDQQLNSNIKAAKEKFKKENQQIFNQALKQREEIQFNYIKVRELYNVSLLDLHFGNAEAYLLKKREDAKATIQHVFRRKFEEKLIFQQLNDEKTVKRERLQLEQKLKMITVAVELAKQRLEWLIYDTPFRIEELEDEVRNQEQSSKDIMKQLVQDFKLDPKSQEMMQKQSRDARNMLKVQMLEVRALKNRTGCESISDFVLLYREYLHIERLEDYLFLINDALLNKKKSEDFFNFIKKIVDFEDQMIEAKKEFSIDKIEEKRIENDKFYNYDDISLSKLKDSEKKQFMENFKQTHLIFQFLPFWYTQLDNDTETNSIHLRTMFKIDTVQAKVLCNYLKATNIEELITYHRHNRKAKDYILFDQGEVSYLSREKSIPLEKIKEFSQIILFLAKEQLMIPQQMFDLAKISKMTEIKFIDYKAEHLNNDALSAIIACIEMYQNDVKKLTFNQCEIDHKGAQLMKIVLSNEKKKIVSCNFDNNLIGDQGIDHIVQAIKNNHLGDMRILQLGNNKLSIQASIRISHLLKKRPANLTPLNIQILKLDNNQIGNIGVETLANFIKNNETLRYLDISFNQVADRGLMSIAECLTSNSTLQVLNILGNTFEQRSIVNLSQSLSDNKNLKLQVLKIGHLNCDQTAYQNFVKQGFLTNKATKYMYATTNQVSEEFQKQINTTFLPKFLYTTASYDKQLDNSTLLELMTYIIENKIIDDGDIQRQMKYGETLLNRILKEESKLSNIEMLIFLFDNIFGPDHLINDQISPYHLFAKHGLVEALSFCIKLGISTNFKTSTQFKDYPWATALHLAAAYSQLDLCNYLVNEAKADIDSKDLNGNTPLHYAGVQGSSQLAKLLIKSKPSSVLITNKEFMLPLHSAIFSDNIECFNYILQETEVQRFKQVQAIKYEKAIDTKTYNGLTPLMVSIEEKANNIFFFLIDQGVELKAQDDEGNTALHRALLCKDEKKAKLLMKNPDCDIDIRNFHSETPIMFAVRQGLFNSVRFLLQKGAEVNDKNRKGDTLLHLAAKADRADVIGLLLDRGLSTFERNTEGLRPQDLAIRQVIKEMLRQDNQKYNIYEEKKAIGQRKAQKIQHSRDEQPPSALDETSGTWYKNQQLAEDNKNKLLNEAMIKYKIDKRETIGSNYKNKYDQFSATKLSQSDQNSKQFSQRGHSQNPKQPSSQQQNLKTTQNDEGEYDEELDEDEEQDQSQHAKQSRASARSKSQLPQSAVVDNHQRNSQLSYKQKQDQLKIQQIEQRMKQSQESAGFRGTAELDKNRDFLQSNANKMKIQELNDGIAVGGGKLGSNDQKKTNTKSQYRPNQTTIQEEEGQEDGEEFEYAEDEEEEFEEEDENQTSQLNNTKRSKRSTIKGTAPNNNIRQ